MPVYKNEKNGTWYAMIRYKDWTGTNKQKYSKSKTAPTEEEREKSRQEYLDRVGVHPDFRW